MMGKDTIGRKDLLDIGSLSRKEIELILQTTKPFKDLFTRSVKKVPTLKGKTVVLLFYEPSTRTRTSFEIAAKRLSADVINISVAASSIVKGESILDTIKTLQAMRTDYIVVRHSVSGVPSYISKNTTASVINAGDGFHAHPTQALLDAFTIKEKIKDLENTKILIVGDILHSRVARSDMECFHKLGMKIGVFGPATLIPANLPKYIKVFYNYDDTIAWGLPDVIYLLRIQLERQKTNFFPNIREYHNIFGITKERFKIIKDKGIYILHPGPVNRGVELIDDVMDYERTLICNQVENGVAVRMSVLYLLTQTHSVIDSEV
ncbi:MAG: aspartate carbamoyltransferase catalytic subunit [Candidatus Hydrogenedentota bacterium]